MNERPILSVSGTRSLIYNCTLSEGFYIHWMPFNFHCNGWVTTQRLVFNKECQLRPSLILGGGGGGGV